MKWFRKHWEVELSQEEEETASKETEEEEPKIQSRGGVLELEQGTELEQGVRCQEQDADSQTGTEVCLKSYISQPQTWLKSQNRKILMSKSRESSQLGENLRFH